VAARHVILGTDGGDRVKRDEDFTAYMSARWKPLVHSAVLLGCPPAEAEDLVQAALVRCYLSWARVQRAANPDAYTYRILVNTLRDRHRRRWRGERPTERVPESAEPADPMAGIDVADAVRRALDDLGADHRAVVVLRYFAHLSEQDTAEALGIARGTVKSRTARALALLATSEHLEDIQDGAS
jgi:RNA polymerase sigma-70 factor (sigma-E family)